MLKMIRSNAIRDVRESGIHFPRSTGAGKLQQMHWGGGAAADLLVDVVSPPYALHYTYFIDSW